MDGTKLPPAAGGEAGIPSVVLACDSEPYWGAPLRSGGSFPLLTTRAVMAPEGYLVDAVARALGDNKTPEQIRAAAIDSGVRWWRLTRPQVGWIFAPFRPMQARGTDPGR